MLHERLGFRPDVIEAQLAHSVRDSLGRAYNTRYSGDLVAIDFAKEAKLRLVGLAMKPAAWPMRLARVSVPVSPAL